MFQFNRVMRLRAANPLRAYVSTHPITRAAAVSVGVARSRLLSTATATASSGGACANCSCGAAAANAPVTATASTATGATAAAPTSVKAKCDPYGQNGIPLTAEQVRTKVLPTLAANEWKLSDDTKTLSRSFVLPSVLHAYQLVDKIGNLSINGAHNAYTVTVVPRRAEVAVVLKTIALGGLSWNDAYLAFQIEQTFELIDRHAKARLQRQNEQSAAAAAPPQPKLSAAAASKQ